MILWAATLSSMKPGRLVRVAAVAEDARAEVVAVAALAVAVGEGAAVVAVAAVAEAGIVTAAIAAAVAVGTAAGSRAVHSGIQVSNRGAHYEWLPSFFVPEFSRLLSSRKHSSPARITRMVKPGGYSFGVVV